jgi:hypothetical protein
MKMFQALAQVAEILNRPYLESQVLDFQTQQYDALVKLLPADSGFVQGTEFICVRSGPNRLVFRTIFQHMDDNGSYDGVTEHEVIVTASLTIGFEIRVTGKNHRDIKEHIADAFNACLSAEAPGTITRLDPLLEKLADAYRSLSRFAEQYGPSERASYVDWVDFFTEADELLAVYDALKEAQS